MNFPGYAASNRRGGYELRTDKNTKGRAVDVEYEALYGTKNHGLGEFGPSQHYLPTELWPRSGRYLHRDNLTAHSLHSFI